MSLVEQDDETVILPQGEAPVARSRSLPFRLSWRQAEGGLAWAMAGVFISAGVTKVLSPEPFAAAIYNYQILPAAWTNAAAIAMPGIEIMASLFLALYRPWRTAAGSVLLVLLAIFTAALLWAIHRGLNISCGCFSTSADAANISWWNIARNAGLAALLMLLVYLNRRESGRCPARPGTRAGSCPPCSLASSGFQERRLSHVRH